MAHTQARVVGNPLLQAAKPPVLQAGSSALVGARLIHATPSQGSVMQRLVRQRYMGTPVIPASPRGGVQLIGRMPVR